MITWRDLWGDPRDGLFRMRGGRLSVCITKLHDTFSDDFLSEYPELVCDDLEGREWGT